jgi:hypothetical protein
MHILSKREMVAGDVAIKVLNDTYTNEIDRLNPDLSWIDPFNRSQDEYWDDSVEEALEIARIASDSAYDLAYHEEEEE